MKKSMTIAASFAFAAIFAACDREDIIPESKLPGESKTFLKTHFDGVGIVKIIREIDGLEKDYVVYLKNGFEVDFRRSGAWGQVEGRDALPESIIGILPAGIPNYVAENHSDRPIVKVNRENWGYEIGLARVPGGFGGDLELDFTESGEFFRYDD